MFSMHQSKLVIEERNLLGSCYREGVTPHI